MKKHILIIAMFIGTLVNAQDFEMAYNHSAFAVNDLDASGKFYSEVLGLKEIEIPYENPVLKWFSLGGSLQLHLIETDNNEDVTHKATHLSLSVSDFDAFVTSLENKNIPYWDWLGEKQKIAVRPDGIKQVYVVDPDGHWIEINNASN